MQHMDSLLTTINTSLAASHSLICTFPSQTGLGHIYTPKHPTIAASDHTKVYDHN
jgi:hypothetical protein